MDSVHPLAIHKLIITIIKRSKTDLKDLLSLEILLLLAILYVLRKFRGA